MVPVVPDVQINSIERNVIVADHDLVDRVVI